MAQPSSLEAQQVASPQGRRLFPETFGHALQSRPLPEADVAIRLADLVLRCLAKLPHIGCAKRAFRQTNLSYNRALCMATLSCENL